jgi:hypothetical protein
MRSAMDPHGAVNAIAQAFFQPVSGIAAPSAGFHRM